jgi:hypothetical protein
MSRLSGNRSSWHPGYNVPDHLGRRTESTPRSCSAVLLKEPQEELTRSQLHSFKLQMISQRQQAAHNATRDYVRLRTEPFLDFQRQDDEHGGEAFSPSVLTSHCSLIRLPTKPSTAAPRGATVTATSAPPSSARPQRAPVPPYCSSKVVGATSDCRRWCCRCTQPAHRT